MVTITIQEAQANLAEVIRRLVPGEELSITDNNLTIAKLVATPPPPPPTERKLGMMKGTVLYIAPDFNAPLDDFAEYM